ncbi:hypothetical protein LSH36_384g05020 [Paralvinella palmiformis]|uniref:Metalloendopeptidase OMA1, mitochondrial n=1 Tax=Paralvinella palmiformis TaxID=53620 RepID=A0AAD9JDI9_9ANNE|nr:hypothetical protein LSH36_384g05020 [Paralvinella palmiformis]
MNGQCFLSLCQKQFSVNALSLFRRPSQFSSIRQLHYDVTRAHFYANNSRLFIKEKTPLSKLCHSCLYTSPRLHINPIFWLLIKPAGKALSIISGRTLRKWWQALPQSEKYKVRQQFYQHRYKITAVISTLVAAGFIYFIMHIQETPVTKRKRYIAFTDKQFMKIAEYELEMQWEALKDIVINPNDPKMKQVYDKVVQVAQRVVDSNQHLEVLKRQKWNVILIDSDEANAFVLPTGQIFVFKGMLNLIENLDQLAVVLGHEIAHVVLNHGAEKVSFISVIDIAVIIGMAAFWFVMPTDGVAAISQWFYNKMVKLLLELPYSRKLETEADEVGLELIARACFDVRESSSFWQRMAFNEELISKGEMPPPEWISTHPASEKRAAILDQLIPEAIKLRECSHCPHLPKFDPRLNLEAVKKIIQQNADQNHSDVSQNVVLKPTAIGINSAAAAAADSAVVSKQLFNQEHDNIYSTSSAKSVIQTDGQSVQLNKQSNDSKSLSDGSRNLSADSNNLSVGIHK